MLNAGKVLLVFSGRRRDLFMRLSLIGYTLIMTLLVAGSNITDSNLEVAYANAKQDSHRLLNVELASIEQRFGQQFAILESGFQQEREIEVQDFQPKDDELTRKLDIERHIGGQNFDGKRYKKLTAMQQTLRAAHRARMDNISKRRNQELGALSTAKSQAIVDANKQFSFTKTREDFKGTAAAQNPKITRLITIINTFYQASWLNPQVVGLIIVALVTILVEFLPMVLLTGLREKSIAGTTKGQPAYEPKEVFKIEKSNAEAMAKTDTRKKVSQQTAQKQISI